MTGLDQESITEAGKLEILDEEGNHVNADVGEKGLYVQVGSNNILDRDYGFASNINKSFGRRTGYGKQVCRRSLSLAGYPC